MPVTDQVGVRTLDTPDDFDEMRLGAIGYVFHGNLPVEGAKKAGGQGGHQSPPLRPMRQAGQGRRDRGQDLVPHHRHRQAAPRREGRHRTLEVVQGLRTRDHPEDPQRALSVPETSRWACPRTSSPLETASFTVGCRRTRRPQSPILRLSSGWTALSQIIGKSRLAAARRLIQLVLSQDLAYNSEIMPADLAVELTGRFLDQFGNEGVRFYTNGTFHETSGSHLTWSGVVGIL